MLVRPTEIRCTALAALRVAAASQPRTARIHECRRYVAAEMLSLLDPRNPDVEQSSPAKNARRVGRCVCVP